MHYSVCSLQKSPVLEKEPHFVLAHQSQAVKKIITAFTDSSVFILELGSSATGPCCNTPFMETNIFMTKQKATRTFHRRCWIGLVRGSSPVLADFLIWYRLSPKQKEKDNPVSTKHFPTSLL